MSPRSRLATALVAVVSAGMAGLAADAVAQQAPDRPAVRVNDAMLVFDYQVIRVPGDEPIDLLGLHLHQRLTDGLYLGVGVYAPHVRGEYGGFMAFDAGFHYRRPIGGRWLATADLFFGGGGGGRSVEQSTALSGTGGFVKASAGLAYDFGPVALGLSATRMTFRRSRIDDTQANVSLSIPYTWLSGPYGGHGRALSATEDAAAAASVGENMLTVTFDNLHQIDPQGSVKDTIGTVDLQYSHYFSGDSYWYAALGVGYRGRPIYNQMMGGVGRRLALTPSLTLYGQLGIGSGGYAPSVIDTGPGLLVYPKLMLDLALTRDIGLSLTAGYLAAPEASARNWTYGLALTQHLRAAPAGAGVPARWRGFRVGLFQQTEFGLRFRGEPRDNLHLVGIQIDSPLGGGWYVPLQAAVAYGEYLGFPGYGELLAGIGKEADLDRGGRLQAFGQLMGGANVHGLGLKLAGGLRWQVDERLSAHVALGRIETRGSGGRSFSANSLGLGIDYRFAVPMR